MEIENINSIEVDIDCPDVQCKESINYGMPSGCEAIGKIKHCSIRFTPEGIQVSGYCDSCNTKVSYLFKPDTKAIK